MVVELAQRITCRLGQDSFENKFALLVRLPFYTWHHRALCVECIFGLRRDRIRNRLCAASERSMWAQEEAEDRKRFCLTQNVFSVGEEHDHKYLFMTI